MRVRFAHRLPLRPASVSVALVAWATLMLPRSATSQDSTNGTRSTLSGVYTREQASRGRDVYAGMCQSCHTPASHTGTVFTNTWAGRPLSDLFAFVSEKMPKNEPGSLTRDEYVQVIAHLLRLNGMPPGFDELPNDSASLSHIRIELKKP